MPQNILDYIAKNKNNYEMARFEADIFGYNHIVVLDQTVALPRILFFCFYPKSEPNHYWFITNKNEQNLKGKKFYKQYKNDPTELRKKFYDYCDTCLDCLKKMENNADKQTYINLAKAVRVFAILTMFVIEGAEKHINKILSLKIPEAGKREILSFPLYTSYVQKQNEELIKIIKSLPIQEFKQLQKEDRRLSQYKNLKSKLSQLNKEWGWTFLNYASHNLPTSEQLLEKAIDTAININKETRVISEIQAKREKKKLLLSGLPKDVQKIIEFLDIAMELRDQRKALFIQMLIPMKNKQKCMAKKHNFSYNDIRWLTWDEQFKLNNINRKKYLNIIAKRRNGCVIMCGYDKKKTSILTGKKANDIMSVLLSRESKSKLTGFSASPGKVTGVVRNINDTKKFNQFKKGEILVASHTTPDYVPVMKKAKAILTERGGVTSHAAIISRELNVPCIVGIHGLFGNFEDGQLVEVDAERGIVKVLQRKRK